MRKWMRDRLSRRKKKTEQAGEVQAGPGPVPIQPDYYESHGESAEPVPAVEPEVVPIDAGGEESAPEMSEPEPGNEAGPGKSEPRRRRRRGRRGKRSGSPSAPAADSAPAAPLQPTLMRNDAPPKAESRPVPATAHRPAARQLGHPPKGVVVLSIGLPGSGKSSWFRRNNITPLSSDLLRGLLFDDPNEQRFQDLVFSNLRSMLRARLVARRPMNYVDATNLTPHERQSWIKLAHDYGYEVHAVFFDVSLEVCLERNQRRQRNVSEDILRKMASKLKPPTFEEGFTKVTVVRVKKKEAAEREAPPSA